MGGWCTRWVDGRILERNIDDRKKVVEMGEHVSSPFLGHRLLQPWHVVTKNFTSVAQNCGASFELDSRINHIFEVRRKRGTCAPLSFWNICCFYFKRLSEAGDTFSLLIDGQRVEVHMHKVCAQIIDIHARIVKHFKCSTSVNERVAIFVQMTFCPQCVHHTRNFTSMLCKVDVVFGHKSEGQCNDEASIAYLCLSSDRCRFYLFRGCEWPHTFDFGDWNVV